jgi:hypothetical protein
MLIESVGAWEPPFTPGDGGNRFRSTEEHEIGQWSRCAIALENETKPRRPICIGKARVMRSRPHH